MAFSEKCQSIFWPPLNYCSSKGYAVAAMNYRFCSGEINRQLITYHSGRTEDLHAVIETLLPNHEEIYLIGFSLGGTCLKVQRRWYLPPSSKNKS